MTLNGGLGNIVSGQKNIPLLNTTSEKLQVVPNASGCGYWLLTMNSSGNSFVAFSITQAGINTTPVVSAVSTTQPDGRGHFKINPQFTKLAMGNSGFFENRIELYDFNNATGIVSNPILWNYAFPYSGLNFAGVEFSPDGTKLYVSNFIRILQYDITLATPALIASSGFNVTAAFPSLILPGTLQLGPDNKIYVASSPLSVINAPNNSGAAANLQLNPIAGFVGTVKYGLPQKIFSLDISVANAIVSSGNCQLNPTQFSLQDNTNVVSATWDFGDPASGASNTATGLSTQHTFSNSGTFTVSVSITYPCNTIVRTQLVTIANPTTPSFTAIPAFNAGTTAPALPTTSLNGIAGIWSPATVSNTASGTYTFTPNAGQCATTSSLSITVQQCLITTSATLTTINCGDSVNLSAFGQTSGTPLLTANFNTGSLPSGWTSSQALDWTNPCSASGVDGTTHLWVGAAAAAPRNVTTNSFNLSSCVNSGVSFCFDLLFAAQLGASPCEGPDLPNEGVYFQYSIDSGATWVNLNYFAPNGGFDPSLINWKNWCFVLPPQALTANTRFRWYQLQSSAASADHWGIDNVVVSCNDPAYTIVWQHDGYTTGAAGGINPTAVSPNATTTYTAVLSNGIDSCSSSVTITVKNPVVNVNAGNDLTICQGACTQLTGTATVINYPAQTANFSSFSVFPQPYEGISNFPLNVTGLTNPILQPNSIASVCISQIFFSGFPFLDVDNIALSLTCPSGQTIVLVPANITNSGPFSATNGYINTCFVPAGPSIAGAAPPTTGNWGPNQPFNNLSGCLSNGQWNLNIIPPAGTPSGSGFFYGWSITFNTP